jgi:peptide/nickel transport system ATP-binding protein
MSQRTPSTTPVLEARDLSKHYQLDFDLFGRPRKIVRALDDVSLAVHQGETVSVVGESGCGKSTLGRTLLMLQPPTSGEVYLEGERVDRLTGQALRKRRRKAQIIFQDPYSSLNPRIRIGASLAEPLLNFGLVSHQRDAEPLVARLLGKVGLPERAMQSYPHEFSGGQRQRIAIARALAPGPSVIVCDEAVSALDVSVKAQIVNLLRDLQAETGLALLFISHDLAIVENLTHRIAVMYLGRIVEIGSRQAVIGRPRHPYTRVLLSAVPRPDPDAQTMRSILQGDVPSPVNPPPGCRFHPRCPHAQAKCRVETPLVRSIDQDHAIACHFDL